MYHIVIANQYMFKIKIRSYHVQTRCKKPEEQYFCYNSTNLTNHRSSLEKCTNKHSSISTKHIDATILKYICKYS